MRLGYSIERPFEMPLGGPAIESKRVNMFAPDTQTEAVIVEKAAEARQTDLDKKLMQKDQVRERNMVELALMCDRMDKDGSGALSLEEMLSGTWVEIGHGMS